MSIFNQNLAKALSVLLLNADPSEYINNLSNTIFRCRVYSLSAHHIVRSLPLFPPMRLSRIIALPSSLSLLSLER